MKINLVSTKLNLVLPGNNKTVRHSKRSAKVLKIIGLVAVYIVLIALALLTILPFFYMISASFMLEEEIKMANSLWPTMGNIFENIAFNYSETISRFSYFRYVGNTLIVGVIVTSVQVFITILSAFAFAKLKFKGRDVVFFIFLTTMMIPGEMMVITNYQTMSNLNLISLQTNAFQSFAAIMLPYFVSIFYIYLLRENFRQIPNELYLSSKVDGKSDWNYLWTVLVPLSKPTITTIIVLGLIESWNQFAWPNLVVNNKDYYLISVALRKAALMLEERPDVYVTQISWIMAATVLVTLPLLLFFIFFRKRIMLGVSRAGIKG